MQSEDQLYKFCGEKRVQNRQWDKQAYEQPVIGFNLNKPIILAKINPKPIK